VALIITSEQVAVGFRFGEADGLPAYQDTLFIDPVEYEERKPGDLGTLCQRRYNAWADLLRNPPPPEPGDEPTKDEVLVRAIEALNQAREAVQAVIDAPEAAIDAEAIRR
jgi:hypothetical protein